MKFNILMTATLMAAFIFGCGAEASTQSKKNKQLKEELRLLKDSLIVLNKQVEALE
jgi:hypothetical protein